jgi:excisionase family DNA binding protein
MDTEPKVGKRTYSVAEIQDILGICRRKAYELCNADAFKVIRVGRTLRISKSSFDYWLDHYEQVGG